METAFAQKKETKNQSQVVSDEAPQSNLSPENELNASVGMPLFLQRSPTSQMQNTLAGLKTEPQTLNSSAGQDSVATLPLLPPWLPPVLQAPFLGNTSVRLKQNNVPPLVQELRQRADRFDTDWHSLDRGDTLPESTRAVYEQGYGNDLCHVRVHTGSTAIALAETIGARAFTVQNHLIFGRGEYQPHTDTGKWVIESGRASMLITSTSGRTQLANSATIAQDTLSGVTSSFASQASELVSTAQASAERVQTQAQTAIAQSLEARRQQGQEILAGVTIQQQEMINSVLAECLQVYGALVDDCLENRDWNWGLVQHGGNKPPI